MAKKKKYTKLKHIFIELFKANIYYVCCSRKDYALIIKKEFEIEPPKKSDEI